MAPTKIEFRKIRDFGETLSDSFAFMAANLKGLLISLLSICGIFLLGQLVMQVLFDVQVFGFLDEIRQGYGLSESNPVLMLMTPQYLMVILFTWLSHVSQVVTLSCYVKIYVEQEGLKPRVEQVWNEFRKQFLKVLIYSLIVGLLILVGCMACLIPGIYLMTVFAPFSLVLVVEGNGFGRSFERCFELIRDNFWISLGIYVVAALILYLSSSILSVIFILFGGLFAFFTTQKVGSSFGAMAGIAGVVSSLFYVIYFCTMALHYYDLAERRDGTGILKQIDQIGIKGNEGNTDSPANLPN